MPGVWDARMGWTAASSWRTSTPFCCALADSVMVDGVERAIERRAGHDARVILRLEGCTDRNGAEAMRGQELLVARTHAPALDADEWWAEDLEGLVVVDGERNGGHRHAAACAPLL